MKYTNKVVIHLPLIRVVDLWKDERYFKRWQNGFIESIPICGAIGDEGAQSEIYFLYNNKKMKLLETILESNLPSKKVVLIEHEHMTNTMTSYFKDLGGGKTEYTMEIEYTKFNGLLPKLMAKLFPGMFKRQSQSWLDQFKVFAESIGSYLDR